MSIHILKVKLEGLKFFIIKFKKNQSLKMKLRRIVNNVISKCSFYETIEYVKKIDDIKII